ncbi:MAG: lipid IV(A) palmitoyltransferase PagP [Methylophilus sp.]|nr:lipid IV(A) palmitoyltransferase PagP [Methylophilus sp.]
MLRITSFFVIPLLLSSPFSQATCDNTWSIITTACQHIEDTWADGDSDLYLPFHAYHLRSAYPKEKIDSFREDNWGIGYGRSHYVDGNWEGLYFMAFLDSHSDIEPMLGYAYQWMWGQQDSLHAGLGYTALLTSRSDVLHFMPFPAVLPIASINYDKLSVNSTFVPGVKGSGNVFFFWSRINF